MYKTHNYVRSAQQNVCSYVLIQCTTNAYPTNEIVVHVYVVLNCLTVVSTIDNAASFSTNIPRRVSAICVSCSVLCFAAASANTDFMTAIRSEVSRHRDIQDDGESDDLRQESLLRFPRTDSDTRDFDTPSGNGEVSDRKSDGYSPRGAASLSGSHTSEGLYRDQRAQGNNLTINEEPHEEIWESPSPETGENQEVSKDEDKFYDQIAQSLSTLHEEHDDGEEEEEEQYSSDDDQVDEVDEEEEEGEQDRRDDDADKEEEEDGSAKLSTKYNVDSTSVDEQCNQDSHEETVQVHDISKENISGSKRSDTPQSARGYANKDGIRVEDAKEGSVTCRDKSQDDNVNKGDNSQGSIGRRTSQTGEETEVDQELGHRPSFYDQEETHSVHSRRVSANCTVIEGSQVLLPKDNSDQTAGGTNKHEDSTSMKSNTTYSANKTEDAHSDEVSASKNSRTSLSSQIENQKRQESKQLSNSRITISSRKHSVKHTDLSSNGSKSSLSKSLKGRKQSLSRKAIQDDTVSTKNESHEHTDGVLTREEGDGFANTSLADPSLSRKDLHNAQRNPSRKSSHTHSGDGNTIDQYVDSKHVDEKAANSLGSLANGVTDTKGVEEQYHESNEGSAPQIRDADINQGSNQRCQKNDITEDLRATEDKNKKDENGEGPSRDVKAGSYYFAACSVFRFRFYVIY